MRSFSSAALDVWPEGCAIQAFRRRDSQPVDYRGENVRGPNLRLHYLVRMALSRELQDQGHVSRRVVKKNSVSVLVMLTQAFAMVSDHDDEGIVVPAGLFQIPNKSPSTESA